MPPVMGAAALVMADITEIAYINIIIAALVPALLYYASLFTSVVFESRRLGIEAVADLSDTDVDLTGQRQDYYNLILIFVPIATVIFALLVSAGTGSLLTKKLRVDEDGRWYWVFLSIVAYGVLVTIFSSSLFNLFLGS